MGVNKEQWVKEYIQILENYLNNTISDFNLDEINVVITKLDNIIIEQYPDEHICINLLNDDNKVIKSITDSVITNYKYINNRVVSSEIKYTAETVYREHIYNEDNLNSIINCSDGQKLYLQYYTNKKLFSVIDNKKFIKFFIYDNDNRLIKMIYNELGGNSIIYNYIYK
jgi:hypothetical protein